MNDLSIRQPPGGTEAQVLIGVDNSFLLESLEVRSSSNRGDPYASRTSLGWSLSGPGSIAPIKEIFSNCVSLDVSVKRIWDIEIGDNQSTNMSIKDKRVVQL